MKITSDWWPWRCNYYQYVFAAHTIGSFEICGDDGPKTSREFRYSQLTAHPVSLPVSLSSEQCVRRWSLRGLLHKRANGIPLITIEYHSVSFSTIGPFNYILGLSSTLNGNLKYHSIPLDKESKILLKKHSDAIQIPLAIIIPSTIQWQFL